MVPIPFEIEFPEEAALLMNLYSQRPKFQVWNKKKRQFVPSFFPEGPIHFSE